MNQANAGEGIQQLSDTGNKALEEYNNITSNSLSKIENSSGIAQTLTFIPGIIIDSMKLLKNIILLVKDYFTIMAINLGVPPIILTILSVAIILLAIILFLRAIGGNL